MPKDVRAVVWWVLVGTGAGALAGAVVGGIGGRLAMLLLRFTSDDLVIGIESDDGFEIGVVSARTLFLVGATAAMGAINGVLYAAVREGLPTALRLPLWTIVGGAVVGAVVVHEDGIDFTVLGPRALAIVLFVALPAIASAAVVILVERWSGVEPWSDARLTALAVATALCGTVALAFSAVVAVGAVAVRRAGLDHVVRRAGRVAVPAAIVVVTLVYGLELLRESARIVD
jgi:hypothetical protein